MSNSSKGCDQITGFDLIESLIEKSKFKEALAQVRQLERQKGLDRFSSQWGWLCHLSAKALQGLGRCEEARTRAQDALRIYKSTQENGKLAQIQFNLGIVYTDLGDLRKAELQFTDAASTYRRVEDKKGVAKTYNELSRLCFTRGRYDTAIEYLSEGLQHCRETRDQKLTATMLGNLGTVYMLSDRWEEARESLLKSLKVKRACKDEIDVCRSQLSLAYLSILLRRFSEGKEYLQAAHRIISKNGYAREEAIYHEYSGELALIQGDLKSASQHYLEAISLGEKIAPRSAIISQAYRLLAELQVEKGELEKAAASSEKSLLASQGVGEKLEEAIAYRTLGRIHSQNGKPPEVRENFDHANRLLEEMGVRFELAKTYSDMGRCDSFTFWERMKFLGKAEDMASRLDTPYYLAKVHLASAELLLENGRLAEAEEFLRKARSTFEEMDEKTDLKSVSALEEKIKASPASAQPASVSSSGSDSVVDMITQDKAILSILDNVRQVKDLDITILLEGETGTGKDVLAKIIHYTSNRKKGKFVVVTCAALPEGLFETELFGHKRGAFTGAVADKKGLVDEACGGTLYLDEIADVPLSIQVKLLRAIEEKEIVRVGEVKPRKVDFRVIAATNRNLDELVKDGKFRIDLFYRLNGIRFKLPPLKERKNDIPLLVAHFLQKCAHNGVGQNGKDQARPPSAVPTVNPEVMERLLNYDWPGNVRELENDVIRMFISCRGQQKIGPDKLGDILKKYTDQQDSQPPSLLDKRDQYVKEEILKALAQTNGVKAQAARLLGIDEALLRYKMKRLNITFP